MIAALQKRWDGNALLYDTAAAPLMIGFLATVIYVVIMAAVMGIEIAIVTIDCYQAARYASIESNQITAQNVIYDQVSKILPTHAAGETLFTTSDIEINQFDGPFVTTKITYEVMAPSDGFWHDSLGIPASLMSMPWDPQFSFLRNFRSP